MTNTLYPSKVHQTTVVVMCTISPNHPAFQWEINSFQRFMIADSRSTEY